MQRSSPDRAPILDMGPAQRLSERFGWSPASGAAQYWLALITTLVCWMPLVVLSAFDNLPGVRPVQSPFLTDITAQARFLLALPCLIIAQRACATRTEAIVRHFLDAGLLRKQDEASYHAACDSARRWLSSGWAELGLVAAAYVSVGALLRSVTVEEAPAWQYVPIHQGRIGLAGTWHTAISLPIVLMWMFDWLYRLVVWARLLIHVSRSGLRLNAAHPDRAGGLMFVAYSIRAFAPLGFAIGAIVAGQIAHTIVREGASLALADARWKVAAVGVVIVTLTCAPLLAFYRPLRLAWERAVFEHGALADRFSRPFEHKWLVRRPPLDDAHLAVADFSAATDLYSTVRNVYDMRLLPIDLRSLLMLLAATLLPSIPVVLMVIPADEIAARLVKLLM